MLFWFRHGQDFLCGPQLHTGLTRDSTRCSYRPSSHFWPVVPKQFTDGNPLRPIPAGFKQYSSSHFGLILASVKSRVVETKTVRISGGIGNKMLDYDNLVLATGFSAEAYTSWKRQRSTETTGYCSDIQTWVKEAHTIVVADAGLTAVEVARDWGFEYGRQNEIILVSMRCFNPPFIQYCGHLPFWWSWPAKPF